MLIQQKVELKCITMVSGGLYVITPGVPIMQRLYVSNLVCRITMHELLRILKQELDAYGLIIFAVQVQKADCQTAVTVDGETITAHIIKTQESGVCDNHDNAYISFAKECMLDHGHCQIIYTGCPRMICIVFQKNIKNNCAYDHYKFSTMLVICTIYSKKFH